MAGVKITASSAAIDDVLSRLLMAAGSLEPALKNIGEAVRASTLARIAAEQTPAGAPFSPLNPLYARTKKGPGILRGESRTLSEIVWQLGGDSVEVGTNAIYGAIHQFGGTIRPKDAPALIFSMGGKRFAVQSVTIPARPFLGISAADETEIVEIAGDFLDEATGGQLQR